MQFTRNRKELHLYQVVLFLITYTPTVPQPTMVHPSELTLSRIRAVQFVESVLLSIFCLDNEVNQRTSESLNRIHLLPVSGNGEPLDSMFGKNWLLPLFRVSFDDPHPWAIRIGKIYLHPCVVLQFFSECWLRVHSDIVHSLVGKKHFPFASTPPHLHVLPKAMVFDVVEAFQRVLPRHSWFIITIPYNSKLLGKKTIIPGIWWDTPILKTPWFSGQIVKIFPAETSRSS